MESAWRIVAFPLILPWRDEFWTLPLYFPDLKVGVIPGWPEQLPYRGRPLPAAAEVHPRELQHLKSGELRQWQAFTDYQRHQVDDEDTIRAIRNYGQPGGPEPQSSDPNHWNLVWQLEKLQADQDAQMLMVDKGQEWLKEILRPEPWDGHASYGPVPDVKEMVDPELAQLRFRLWRQVMAASLENQSAPLLLGRASRSLFLTLRGWPDWTGLQAVRLSLPGCRTRAEWLTVCGDADQPPWQQEFTDLLGAMLTAVADLQDLAAASQELREFVEDEIVPWWPFPPVWNWDLEVWAPDAAPVKKGPVLCWVGADTGILPG